MQLMVVLGALITSRIALIFVRKDRVRDRLFYRIMAFWSRLWGFLVGIRFYNDPEGQRRFIPGAAYVVVANHISFLDIHTIACGINAPFRALGKKELLKMPLLGALVAPGIVAVDRSSSESRNASMRALLDTARRGISIAVFPEGTRNRKQEQPLRDKFYDGAFRIAINLQIPVMVMVITGARHCMAAHTFRHRPGVIRTYCLQPVSTEGLTEADAPALRDRVYEMMDNALRELDPYFRKGHKG